MREPKVGGVFSVDLDPYCWYRPIASLFLSFKVCVLNFSRFCNCYRPDVDRARHFGLDFSWFDPLYADQLLVSFSGVEWLCGVGKRHLFPLFAPVDGRRQGCVFVLFYANAVVFALVPGSSLWDVEGSEVGRYVGGCEVSVEAVSVGKVFFRDVLFAAVWVDCPNCYFFAGPQFYGDPSPQNHGCSGEGVWVTVGVLDRGVHGNEGIYYGLQRAGLPDPLACLLRVAR